MSICLLPKELQEKSKKELNEDCCRTQDDLKHIRDWLSKQPHLIVRNDDRWLLGFLRNAKFSLEKAKEKLDFYYTMRTISPELFNDRDPFSPKIQEILKRGIFSIIMDNSKPLLPVIMVVQWKKADPDKVSAVDLLKMQLMISDILINENDNIIINGMHLIEDSEEASISYAPQFTPSLIKKLVMSLQDTYPIRLKGLHFINVPSFAVAFINLAKSFMKAKTKNRLNVYTTDFKGIHKDIPLSLLPKEYGGAARSLDELSVECKKKVESYRDWFLNDVQYRTDETKRPGKPKSPEDVFGADGSFRKLNID